MVLGGGEGIWMNIFSDGNNGVFKDIIFVGCVFVGGMVGFFYELLCCWLWIVEVNVLVGFLKVGIGFDFNMVI